jgi:hypothetical protein
VSGRAEGFVALHCVDCLVRGLFVGKLRDGDACDGLRQLERDVAPDAAQAAGDQRRTVPKMAYVDQMAIS